MLRRRRNPDHHAAIDRVTAWTRERFRLSDEVTVSVAELACQVPGCPPIETVIVFWTAPDKRHHWKVFKPLADVTPDDLPPWWMKDRLIDTGDCDCC
jgi:nitrate reductase delta subunit